MQLLLLFSSWHQPSLDITLPTELVVGLSPTCSIKCELKDHEDFIYLLPTGSSVLRTAPGSIIIFGMDIKEERREGEIEKGEMKACDIGVATHCFIIFEVLSYVLSCLILVTALRNRMIIPIYRQKLVTLIEYSWSTLFLNEIEWQAERERGREKRRKHG